ncbi:ATP-binding protein [Bifidobacterium aemilianum]|uniref:ATP-binding protein n=1 Tax=Bifidobacterium aemilianum TaxID=2493120 RepID=A0A366KA53_9BIFI|nr:DUF3107 domain-containing protein [Bifidobacterium aemilianum]RBP98594.1 ATP-binding protein [Bifidobacterium aemilianum]
MEIELGIQNVARPVNVSSDQSREDVSKVITEALEADKTIDLTDDKGRRILIPAKALGYAIVGSETRHAVGFGAL